MENKQLKSFKDLVLSSIFFSVLLYAVLYILNPVPVFAAEIFFEQEKNFGLKDQFVMNVLLTAEEEINAVEGEIHFSSEMLEIKNIATGNSIINFWLEQPEQRQGAGDKQQWKIIFSGITPGGYRGNNGLLFSMTFFIKKEGDGVFEIMNARALRNDGKGSEAELQTFSARFLVSKKDPVIQLPVSEVKDDNQPESFAPLLARDPALFKGKWFVVFSTQDKASGIDYYEVKETRQKILSIFSKWIHAESPYELRDQELKSYIYVKAVDKTGNERIIKIAPRNPLAWYENYENWIIIVLMIIVVIALFWLRKKNKKFKSGY